MHARVIRKSRLKRVNQVAMRGDTVRHPSSHKIADLFVLPFVNIVKRPF
jgi:hypothetical protein